MPSSNYPPGVSGNEPQITGVWPPHAVADYCHEQAANARRVLEDLETLLDDQGALGIVETEVTDALAACQALIDVSGRIEPPDIVERPDEDT